MALHDISHTLRFGASPAQAKGAVILIHGRGASAEDISGLAEELPANGIAFAAPDASQGTWYPQRFFQPLNENEPWLSGGLNLIDQLVAELHHSGIPYERIGLAGFSQGGCLALEYAARHPRAFAFVAGLSSALIGPLHLPRTRASLTGVPVLIGCAKVDPHIPLPYVEESAEILSRFGATVTKQIYPGNDHTVFPQEIDWLASRLSTWK
jgi:phospholipase/carboxylesterase